MRAEHITPRLPYMGICSEPQRRITSLLGETADAGLRKRIQTTLGGEGGCGQLYDLTAGSAQAPRLATSRLSDAHLGLTRWP